MPAYDALRPFKVERLGETELDGTLSKEWDALHARISPSLPFSSATWNSLWWKHHRSRSFFKRDELCLLTVRDARNALIAVAPMLSTQRPSFGPFRLRTLRYFGADPHVTEISGLVCEPADEVAALEVIRAHLQAQRPRADWIEWGALRYASWATARAKLEPGPNSSELEIDGYHLELPASWEALRSSRSRNIKESIRRCYNSLKREGLTPELRVVQAPEETPAAVATFFRLHTARSLASNTVVHLDVFQREADRAFLSDYALELARRGQLRIFQLLISGTVVATRLGFQCNDQIYLHYSGYDPKWSRYSVMTTLVVEAIKWSIDQRLAILHLSTGTDVSKSRWSPIATRYVALTEVSPGWRSALLFRAYRRAQQLALWLARKRNSTRARLPVSG